MKLVNLPTHIGPNLNSEFKDFYDYIKYARNDRHVCFVFSLHLILH